MIPIDNFQIGKAIPIQDGERVAVFSTGGIFDEAQETCKLLRDNGWNPALYTFPTVKPIDQETIRDCAARYEWIVTVEEHNIIGGFGSAVAEILAEVKAPRAQLMRIGLNDQYSSIVGTQKYLRDCYGMSAAKIANRIQSALTE